MMGSEEYTYSIDWYAFSEHLKLMFKDLYMDGRYSDVTLVSDDQTQFKAHKIVKKKLSIPKSLETQSWISYIEKSDLNITERVIQL